MALAYLYDPLKQWQNVAGVNNVSGWLEVFVGDTDDHATCYSDFSGTMLPDRIGIDNNGRAPVIVESEVAYRVEVHDASGDLRFTQFPVWPMQGGGGVVGSFVDIKSTDGSVDVQKTTVGSTTTYDLSVSEDSTELLEWAEFIGYTMDGDHMVPSYYRGTIDAGSRGVLLKAGQYYHVSVSIGASSVAQDVYDTFQVSFKGIDSSDNVSTFATESFQYDASTGEGHSYSMSFDVMPSTDVEMFAQASGLESGISAGIAEIYVHRVYSGAPTIPGRVADKDWVEGNFQETLVAGQNISIVGNVISGVASTYTAGTGIDIDGSTGVISTDFTEVQEKLTAGSNIVIEGSTISATAAPQVQADWTEQDTSAPSYIEHKPTLSAVATSGDYSDLSNTPDLSIYAETANLATVATTGDYTDLSNTPDLSIYAETSSLATVATTGDYTDLSNTPDLSVYAETANLATVATTGDYNDLLNTPAIPSTLTAGNGIDIISDVVSAKVDGTSISVNASGELEALYDDNTFVAVYGTTTYQEIAAARTAEKAIFLTGVSGASTAVYSLTSFNSNPAMAIFTVVIGSTEYRAKIDQGVWSNDSVSLQADWNESNALAPAYINNKPTLAAVATSGSYSDLSNTPDLSIYAETSSLATVATSGSYTDLSNTPAIPAAQVQTDWDATTGMGVLLNKPSLAAVATSGNYSDLSGTPNLATVATTGAYSDLSGTPNLAAVATSGSYNDLSNTPTIPAAQVQSDWAQSDSNAVDYIKNKPSIPSGQIQSDWTQSDSAAVDFIKNKPTLAAVATSGAYGDLSGTPQLATVATSGSYADLTNKPSIPAAQVQSDWTQSDNSAVDFIKNKPALAAVATSGSYADLSNKPSIPAAQVQTDWNATTGMGVLLNKPSLAAVATSGAYGDLSGTPQLATVATSGSYSDLSNTPDLSIYAETANLATVATSGAYSDLSGTPNLATVATSGSYSDLSNTPDLSIYAESANLATVATTGSYNDLIDCPSFATVAATGDYDDLIDKPNLATVATSGSYTDLSNKPDLSIYAQSANLATVATSGSYNDLSNKPSIPAAQVQTDWNATTGMGVLLNKPTLAAVATSGAYSDLSGKPTLAAVATSGSYSDLSGTPNLATVATSGSYADLSNKPDLSIYAQSANLATVATSGSYADLSNKPTIPAAQVQSDWTESDNTAVDYIQNKPTLIGLVAGNNISITEASGSVTISATAAPQVQADWTESDSAAASYIAHKPSLATVATSGSYTDLSNTPIIPAAQVQSDWSEGSSSSVTYIRNKPTPLNLIAGTGVTLTESGNGLTISASGGSGGNYSAGNMISLANDTISVSTTAGITDIQVVNALPLSPTSTVMYLIPAN